MATETTTDFTLDSAAVLAEDEGGPIEGKSPWLLAWRRLRRNYVALGFLLLFVLIVVACMLAGPYARHVAHTTPNVNHLGETFTKDGKQVEIVSKGGFTGTTFKAGGIPVGPQLWHAGGRYVLGADTQGRDVAVRLLYGGQNSLKVGIGSAIICTLFALILALLAGYYGGWVDWVLSRFFDLIWAFPVLLLAIALGTALSINGFHHFGISIPAGSLWIPTAGPRVRPDPVHRATAPGADPLAAGEGVHRGGDGAGLELDARDGERTATEHRILRCSCSSRWSSQPTSSRRRASRSSGLGCSRRIRPGGR